MNGLNSSSRFVGSPGASSSSSDISEKKSKKKVWKLLKEAQIIIMI